MIQVEILKCKIESLTNKYIYVDLFGKLYINELGNKVTRFDIFLKFLSINVIIS